MEVGDTVNVSCLSGYNGGGTWTCQNNGSWTGTVCNEELSVTSLSFLTMNLLLVPIKI